ncbi:hypothetical protein H6P81_017214 [Aristolochia fimbriata]|uniref:TIR domain-containing protein n=1 Tax=Aristolochia fimbriata TaxID=158543 RepID=A0AAV7DXJ2_ARIFI|nr:hypothetical protein H6P81_017214 [Aristolochia fimbriata]
MELQQDSSKLGALSATTSRNLSSSSSAFVSAIQSPFFSPRTPKSIGSESTRYETANASNTSVLTTADNHNSTVLNIPSLLSSPAFHKLVAEEKIPEEISSPNGVCTSTLSNYSQGTCNGYSERREKTKKWERSHWRAFARSSTSASSSNRPRSCDVYIGCHGRKPYLLRFVNWLRAELELQGMSCFAVDRARCRNSWSHDAVERAMNGATIGIVVLTRKSFGNPYSIEEIRNFLDKKNLIPIFFDVSPGDCLARDIIEKRGELWEKHGGELWMLYGGLEREWRDAINGLLRVDEWNLEAHTGNWRDCIMRTVVVLATRLGRRSIVDRVNRWVDRVAKEEFPFPRNEIFIGRKKELSELELILFGDISGDGEKEYFELKTRHRRKSVVIGRSEKCRVEERGKGKENKGKDPVVWMESEKEIEMQRVGSPQRQFQPLRRHPRRKRSKKILYGKGIACVNGDSGIGKTELLLEFAYRFSQRYKMVLWVGGESRYIRQNFLNLRSFLEVDLSVDNQSPGKGRVKSFEEQEEEAILRVKKELMRDIPFLVIIDNLENEKDWWDQKFVMDLLPRFGGVTHIIISTRLPRVMNLEPLKLSYMSGLEAMSLMKGRFKDYSIVEIDALRVIEEKLGRLTLGLAIVGAILSELPINPSRLLDTINRMPLRDTSWSGREVSTVRKLTFLMQLLDVCFSIFDHAEGPRSLATRMAQVSGWFATSAVPISLLALAAHKLPEKRQKSRLWKICLRAITCGFTKSYIKKSETEAASMLVRFGIARSSTKQGNIHFHEIVKLYAQKRGAAGVPHAVLQAICVRGSIPQHLDHLWAACFLLLGFGSDPVVVELKVPDLLLFVNRVVLPLAIHSFITYSRCSPALELLRLCTNALEAAEEPLVARVEKLLDRSLCWRSGKTNAQLNPYLWQELALMRASVLETRAKLMIRGGEYDLGDNLIRKAIFIRTSICGESHPDTVSAQQILGKITRLLTTVQG